MSQILSNGHDQSLPRRMGAKGWVVKGLRYENSAAKFWSSLVDEVMEDFPESDGLALSALCGGALTPELLSPDYAFQETLESLADADLQQVFHDTLRELEILGPPPPVRVELFAGERAVYSRDIPLDCADADLFPFLLVWLLEWSEISEFAWNREEIGGQVRAADVDRRLIYFIRFSLQSTHLSEGLFNRRVVVQFRREGGGSRRRGGMKSAGNTPH